MINVCYWCKRAKDGENGTPLYNDYDFCHTCKEMCDKGITLIQVTEDKNGNPPISEGLYPTGRWIVVKDKTIMDVFKGSGQLQHVLITKTMYINKNDWETLGLP